MSIYHEGERAVQERAGVVDMAARVGRSIGTEIPERAAQFLRERTEIWIAATDEDGRPWASVLTGAPNFLDPVDTTTLRIRSLPTVGDPIRGALGIGSALGTITLDPSTRRRARLNGVVTSVGEGEVVVSVQQVYANCPKYIQRRTAPESDRGRAVSDVLVSRSLDHVQRDTVETADTFFVASVGADGTADASHRGGRPGFVRVVGGAVLWPDYAGNTMFNTLGNIESSGRAGLIFPDYTTGSVLQVTGRAGIDWDPARIADFEGAERLVRLEIDQVVQRAGVLLPGSTLIDYSPFNP